MSICLTTSNKDLFNYKEAVCFLSSETDTQFRDLYDEWTNSLQIDLKEKIEDPIETTQGTISVVESVLVFKEYIGSNTSNSISLFISSLGLLLGMIGFSRSCLENRFITKIHD